MVIRARQRFSHLQGIRPFLYFSVILRPQVLVQPQWSSPWHPILQWSTLLLFLSQLIKQYWNLEFFWIICNLRHSKHYLTLTVIIYSISTTRPYTLHPISMHDHLHHNKTPHTIKHIKLEDPTFTSPLHSHFKCRHAMLLPTKSCWELKHIPFPQLIYKNWASILLKVFTPH